VRSIDIILEIELMNGGLNNLYLSWANAAIYGGYSSQLGDSGFHEILRYWYKETKGTELTGEHKGC